MGKKKRKKSKGKSYDELLRQIGQAPKRSEEDDNGEAPHSAKKQKIQASTSQDIIDFPFPTDPDDHCESPKEAYEHVQCLLQRLRRDSLRSEKFTLYDPYYCSGTVKQNLNELGFEHVYNEKEDCYEVWKDSKRYPSFDCFVTNPPYSGDHIEKLMRHITSARFGSKPWLLLMPTWVHKKEYYNEATASIRPFYIVPKKRYVYLPPQGYRESKKSDTHRKSSPFVSMWYVWGGTASQNEALIQLFLKDGSKDCDLARSKSALRDLRRKK